MIKKFTACLLAAMMTCALAACGGTGAGSSGSTTPAPETSTTPAGDISQPDATPESDPSAPPPEGAEAGNILIAYFSATGNTERIADHLDAILDADLYEIVPQEPYTSADLNYNSSNSRAEQEINDPAARPAISGQVDNMEEYDVIFLGYPIWWGQAPKIVYTFLESYDLSGKTIVPFCTSASSGIGTSASGLHSLAPDANWLDGQRFLGSASQSTVESWVNGLDLLTGTSDDFEGAASAAP